MKNILTFLGSDTAIYLTLNGFIVYDVFNGFEVKLITNLLLGIFIFTYRILNEQKKS